MGLVGGQQGWELGALGLAGFLRHIRGVSLDGPDKDWGWQQSQPGLRLSVGGSTVWGN